MNLKKRSRFRALLALAVLAGCNAAPVKITDTHSATGVECPVPRWAVVSGQPNFSVIFDYDDWDRTRTRRVYINDVFLCQLNQRGMRLDLALPDGNYVLRVSYSKTAESFGSLGETFPLTFPGAPRYLRLRFNEWATGGNPAQYIFQQH